MPFLPDPADPSHAAPTPPVGYSTCELLGRGGFGSVWRAEGHGGAPCALKFISLTTQLGQPELRSVLKMKGIKHVYLVPLHNIWLRDSTGRELKETGAGSPLSAAAELVIAMGLGTGTLATLAEGYRKRGEPGIPPGELLRYMFQAAEAIDFLNEPRHDLGGGSPTSIHHCDIKPANLLTTHGGVWVCDFGIARFRRPESTGNSMASMAGLESALTPPYAPPELILNKKDNTNTDQYSLAITYYELRTGRLPFSEEDLKHYFPTFQAHVEGRLDFGAVHAAEQAVLRKATAVNQSDRFASAVEMVEELYTVAPGVRRPGSSGKIPVFRQAWSPEEGQEVVPGYRLRRRRDDGDDDNEAWAAETGGGGGATLQIVRPLDGDPGPVCRALELLKAVSHPGITEVLGWWLLDARGKLLAGVADGQARALVVATRPAGPGCSLLKRLDDVRQDGQWGIPRPELLSHLRQAAETLDHLGAVGMEIQHGDVRPESLHLLYPQGEAKRVVLTRFGSARVLDAGRVAVPRERGGTGAIYRPPETFSGERLASCDQYGLAVTYYHLRTGRPPRAASRSAFETAVAIQKGLPGLDDLPGPEREVVERATDPDPSKRFGSCLELIDALEACPPLPLPESSERVSQEETLGRRERGLVHTILPDFTTDVGTSRKGNSSLISPAARTPAAAPETKALVTDTDDFGSDLVTDSVLFPNSDKLTLPKPGPKSTTDVPVLPAKKRKPFPALVAVVVLAAVATAALLRSGAWLLPHEPPAPLASAEKDNPPAPEPPAAPTPAPAKATEPEPARQVVPAAAQIERPKEPEKPAVRKPDPKEDVRVSVAGPLASLLKKLDRKTLKRPDLTGVDNDLRSLNLAGAPREELDRVAALQEFLAAAGRAYEKSAPEAIDRLAGEVKKLKNEEDRLRVRGVPPALKSGLAQDEANRIRSGLRALAEKELWEAELKACEWAEQTPWVQACKVECLAELARKRGDTRKLEEARRTLDGLAVSDSGGLPAYLAYVAALAQFVLANEPQANPALVPSATAIAPADNWPAEIRGPHRSGRARDMLLSAGRGLRNLNDLLAPYAAPDAEKAVSLLEKALQFGEPAGADAADLKLHLALADWCKRPRAGKLCGQLAGQLVRDKGFDDLLPPNRFVLLVIHAETVSSEDAAGRGERLASYIRAAKLAAVKSNGVTPADLYKGVVAPSEIAAEEAERSFLPATDPARGQSGLAELCADVAATIKSDPEGWAKVEPVGKTAPEQSAVVARLYERAARLEERAATQASDPQEKKSRQEKVAEYIVRGVGERFEQSRVDRDALLHQVNRAIEYAPRFADGYILHGAILTTRARSLDDYRDRIESLREAEKSFDKAIELGAGAGTHAEDVLFRSRNIAFIELANFVRDRGERERYLRGALESAEKVSRKGYEDWLALGNAREDNAWLLDKPADYPLAVKAFTSAYEIDLDRAKAMVALGRVRFKWAEAVPDAGARQLDQAVDDLRKAGNLAVAAAERAEASYWHACALLLQRSRLGPGQSVRRVKLLADAEQDLANGLKKARNPQHFPRLNRASLLALGAGVSAVKDPAPDWAEVILRKLAEINLQEADGGERDRRLKAATAYAADLEQRYSPVFAAWVRGRVLSERRKRREALAEYDAGLKAPQRLQDRDVARRIRRERLFDLFFTFDEQSSESVLAEAAETVKLSSEAGMKKSESAEAKGRAGLLFNKASKWPSTAKADADKYSEEALRLVRSAIEDSPHHEESDTWRVVAAQILTRDNPSKEALEEARHFALSANGEQGRKVIKSFIDRAEQ